MKKVEFKTRPVTEEEYRSVTSMVFTDAKISDYLYPFVLEFPNPVRKREVKVSITQYSGFPHYWTKIREDENHLLGMYLGKLVWLKFSRFEDLDLSREKYMEVRDLINGKDFTEECNTIEEAEAFIKKITEAHFSDETLYEINHTDDYYTDNYRDGD